jgi:hypothetical protein
MTRPVFRRLATELIRTRHPFGIKASAGGLAIALAQSSPRKSPVPGQCPVMQINSIVSVSETVPRCVCDYRASALRVRDLHSRVGTYPIGNVLVVEPGHDMVTPHVQRRGNDCREEYPPHNQR